MSEYLPDLILPKGQNDCVMMALNIELLSCHEIDSVSFNFKAHELTEAPLVSSYILAWENLKHIIFAWLHCFVACFLYWAVSLAVQLPVSLPGVRNEFLHSRLHFEP